MATQLSAEDAMNRISAIARACEKYPDEFKVVHDFVVSQLNELPKGSGETVEERMMSKLAKVYSNAVSRPDVRGALEKIHGEAARLQGSAAPATFIIGYIIAGEFIVVGGITFAIWCAADPSGC